MNSKSHFYISIIKSALRIAGCIIALKFSDLTSFIALMLSAEVLGIVEEIFDER